MLFAPFFGSVAIPARVKAVLVLALTFLLYPAIGHNIASQPMTQWPFLVFTEFLIGAGMGIATNLVFEAVQLSGQVLGIQMGYSLVNILDPQTQVDTTVMAMFYQSIVMLLFLRMDVHYWLLRAVGNSFDYLPPGTAHLSGLFTMGILRTVGRFVRTGSADCRARAGRNAGRRYRAGPARQGFSANAAHAAGARGEEPSGHGHSDRNAEVLAGPVPALVSWTL